MEKLYRTSPAGPVHFIGGELIAPGEVVRLPPGVHPGKHLTELKPKEARAIERELAEDDESASSEAEQ